MRLSALYEDRMGMPIRGGQIRFSHEPRDKRQTRSWHYGQRSHSHRAAESTRLAEATHSKALTALSVYAAPSNATIEELYSYHVGYGFIEPLTRDMVNITPPPELDTWGSGR